MSNAPRVRPETPAAPLPAATRAPLSAIDVLAFVWELLAFGALALWGFAMWAFPWNIAVGIGVPVVAILLWALFVSPRAVLAVHPFVRGFVEVVVYASATFALWSMGLTWVGLVFAVVAVTVGVVTGRRRLA